jgi:Protein of unknown function (DUF1569)
MKTLSSQNCHQELRERIGEVQPHTARRWGKMTAQQMICHLTDGFRMYMALLPTADASSTLLRRVIKPIALWMPIPWPHGFRTPAELDQQGDGTRPAEFGRDVDQLLALIAKMISLSGDFKWPAHPYFGLLSEKEWMRLAYLHVNHHLRQFGC